MTSDHSALTELWQHQRQAFQAEPYPGIQQRQAWLKQLRAVLLAYENELLEAVQQDFGRRSAMETRVAELLPSLKGIDYARRHLGAWLRPKRRRVSWLFQPAKAKVLPQPKGVVGIIVPWNYPIYLALGPLTAALAAGNRVLLKVSEYTPATSAVLSNMLAQAFSSDQVAVVQGGPDTGAAFSALPFDHLLFTGSTRVGKAVMAAAAQNLTPVTLELGGKSPAIIGQHAQLEEAAQRLVFGKGLNAGQTCVAPDYILYPAEQENALLQALQNAWQELYPAASQNPDYTAILQQGQYQRLTQLLTEAEQAGARLHWMQQPEEQQQQIMPPCLVTGLEVSSPLLQEEIFGPILPLVPYQNLAEAVQYIQQGPRPLALYYFGHHQSEQQQLLEQTHSGGVAINDTVLQVAQEDLPFGGVGASGMGAYHGREGFETFSHQKAVFTKGRLNSARLIYPPYQQRLLLKAWRWLFR